MADGNRHFDRFNALLNNGWLKILKPIELQVWLAYEKHADSNGVSFPGPKAIAEYIGHNRTAHIRGARRVLRRYGLLEVISEGGGSEPSKVRLTIPPSPNPTQVQIRPRSEMDRHPSPKWNNPPAPPYKEEHPNKPSSDISQRGADRATVDAIYLAYPRHIGKGAAIHKIEVALKALAKRPDVTDPGAWLLGRTKAYAEARNKVTSKDPAQKQYTPHPATWFGQQRYDDDPSEWSSTHGEPNHKQPRTAAERGEFSEDSLYVSGMNASKRQANAAARCEVTPKLRSWRNQNAPACEPEALAKECWRGADLGLVRVGVAWVLLG